MEMNEMEGKYILGEIRKHARKLLKEEKVDCVIGYEQSGRDEGRTRPFFAKSPDDADRLVWNNSCANNLAVYLLEKLRGRGDGDKGAGKRVAIIAKGCDSRSIVELIKAGQVKRDDVFVIGIPCSGIESSEGGDEGHGEGKEPGPLENCRVCRHRNPAIYDVFIGKKTKEVAEDDYRDVEKMESLSLAERFEFFRGEFQKCIKCFACRNVCPVCYCEECVLEKKDPCYISRPKKNEEMFLFHLIRTFHTAGNCVDCGACERACPVGIPLMLLHRKVSKDVKELFDYEAGVDIGEKPPLTKFDLVMDEKL